MISDSIGHPDVAQEAGHVLGASHASSKTRGYMRTLGAGALAFLIAFQLTKVPFYWNLVGEPAMTNTTWDARRCVPDQHHQFAPRPCHGLEVSENLHATIGLRSYKLRADPLFFLAPHTIMACGLLAILALVLVKRVTMMQAAAPYFVLLALLVLHVWPVRQGIPTPQLNGAPNTFLVLGALATVAMAFLGLYLRREDLLTFCFVVSSLMLAVPIVGEMNIVVWQMCARLWHGNWPSVEGNAPSRDFGHDFYAQQRMRWLGWVLNSVVIGGVGAVLLGLGAGERATGLTDKAYHRVGHQ